MIESLTAWVKAAMIVAWLFVGKIVGITPTDVAAAFAKASAEAPLYEGEDGARKTTALLTAVGVFESGFNNKAKGDCKDKPPGWPGCGKEPDSKPTSFCIGQVHFADGVERVKGYTPDELMADPLNCARAMREILRDSIKAHTQRLKDNPNDQVTEPLLNYAGTGTQARRRFDLARKLFKEVPWNIRCD